MEESQERRKNMVIHISDEMESDRTLRASSIPDSVSLVPTQSPNKNEDAKSVEPEHVSKDEVTAHGPRTRYPRRSSSGRAEVDESPESSDSDDETVEEKPSARSRGPPRKAKESKTDTTRKTPVPKKRSHNDEDTEKSKVVKRPRKNAPLGDVEKFQLDISSLGERYAAQGRALEESQAEVQELREQIEIYQSTIQRHEIQEAALNRSADVWHEKHQKQEKSFTELREVMAEILERSQDDGTYSKVSDSTIIGEWKKMSYSIRNLVCGYLTSPPVEANSIPDCCGKDEYLIKLAESCYSKPHLRSSYLENYMWRINWLIFTGKGSIWAGKVGDSLTQFVLSMQDQGFLEPTYLSLVSRIKSRLVPDIDQMAGIDRKAAGNLVKSIAKDMFIFMPGSKPGGFRKAVAKLVDQAVHLHAMLLGSKAIFVVGQSIEESCRYDPERMEALNGNDEAPESDWDVDLTITLTLEKIGNADGENFDSRLVLCKVRVLVK